MTASFEDSRVSATTRAKAYSVLVVSTLIGPHARSLSLAD